MQKNNKQHRKKPNPLDLGSRYQTPPDLTAKGMQQPIINIQNAPAAPDPTGIGAMSGLLATQNLFKDLTGLEGTQNIALQGMLGNQQAALGYAKLAAELTANAQKAAAAIDEMEASGQISPQKAKTARDKIADAVSNIDWSKADLSNAVADANAKPEDYGLGKKSGNLVDDISALGAAGVKSYKHDGMEVEFGESAEDSEECCAKSIKEWQANIRTPLFTAFNALNPAPTTILSIQDALQPLANQLKDQFKDRKWFNFCHAKSNHTTVRLISTTLQPNITGSVNIVGQLAAGAIPITVNLRDKGHSLLIPTKFKSTDCDMPQDVTGIILGIKYTFDAKNDADQISFKDNSGADIIPPATFGTPGFTATNGVTPTANAIVDAFIPIALFGNATSFTAIVTPVATNITSTIYDLKISLIVLDPWPAEY
jgi:hypothetical protein